MPRWVEHRTPSFFWIDGRVVFEVCNEGQQEAITSAFDGFVDGDAARGSTAPAVHAARNDWRVEGIARN